ncbi:Biotin apo-protein ligase-related protein [Diplonema papillatum]|nr:Biotin apo-protein ligase-related protein [Diplonema papillatum]
MVREAALRAPSSNGVRCRPLEVQSQQQVLVALYDDVGGSSAKKGVPNCRGAADLEDCLRARAKAGRLAGREFLVQRVTGKDIAGGVLKRQNFDVLIHPGGEGYAQGRRLGHEGMRLVKEFVSQGGGYVGICAGANLASADDNYAPYRIGLVASRTLDSTPQYPNVKNLRGVAMCDIELNDVGREVFRTDAIAVKKIVYANGPLFLKDDQCKTEDAFRSRFEILARYSSEVAASDYGRFVRCKGNAYRMTGKPAIIACPYGLGRVLCFSPHPEKPNGSQWMIRAAVRWVSCQTCTPDLPFRPLFPQPQTKQVPAVHCVSPGNIEMPKKRRDNCAASAKRAEQVEAGNEMGTCSGISGRDAELADQKRKRRCEEQISTEDDNQNLLEGSSQGFTCSSRRSTGLSSSSLTSNTVPRVHDAYEDNIDQFMLEFSEAALASAHRRHSPTSPTYRSANASPSSRRQPSIPRLSQLLSRPKSPGPSKFAATAHTATRQFSRPASPRTKQSFRF